ncbi:Ig-like domain-containing protein [Lysinibacter cavernae]|uniref:Ribosomal protein L11/protocatechuate 3,4-dioxygenase beta subunit n=1 Tax=Lysinibacter cavernae TaxID=1640652 RepID=A0A7X5TU54_9MICO|nr:Ig-like domain-containing protein [Lysinibacter cavernae]NIH54023.1 ribosomal protein L11/protocatechuate 3,4-dioxygenase beta subunit [Lysinibacter cavernae]
MGRSLDRLARPKAERRGLVKRSLSLTLVAALAAGGSSLMPTSAEAATVVFPVNMDFSSGAANAAFVGNNDFWVFGAPTYSGATATNSGADGIGWLQLTKNATNQTGALISKQSIPVNEGANFEFDFRGFAPGTAQRADGFSFFLTDGDDPNFVHTRIGAAGSGLGYTSACNGTGTGVNGMEKGYLGIGFDTYGSFSVSGGGSTANRNDQRTGQQPSLANGIVLRGSGDGGAGTGQGTCGVQYNYASAKALTNGSLSQGSVTGSTAQFRRARVAVTPQENAGPRITVSVSALTAVGREPASWENNVLDYQVIPGNGVFNTLPKNLRFGFAASTGGLSMATQIGNIHASTSTDAALTATPIATSGANGIASRGDNVSFSLTATNAGPAPINGAGTPGTSRIYQNLAALGLENATWTCEANGGAVCEGSPVQNGTVLSQDWYGPVGSSVTLKVAATVAANAPLGLNSANAIIPTDFDANVIDPNSVAITPTGSVSDSNMANNSAAMSLTVLALPSAQMSTFVVTPGTKLANGTDFHTLTATVKDTENVAKPGAVVNFVAPEGVTLSATSAVSAANGVASVTAVSTAAAPFTVSATVSGTQIGSDQTITFVAGAPSVGGENSTSNFEVTTGSLPADGAAAHTVKATVRDANGNPVKDQVVTFASPTGTQLSAPTATTNPSGIATVSITATKAGDHSVTASVLGTSLTGTATTATFEAATSSIGANGKSDVTVTTDESVANGSDTQTVTATIRDANNNPKSGVTVDFVALDSAATVKTASAVTNENGVASTEVTAKVAGSHRVAATVGGVAVKNSPVAATFIAGEPTFGADGTSIFEVTDGEVEANGVARHGASATVRDADGNPVAGVTVNFTVSDGAQLSVASSLTNADGIASTQIASSSAGSYTVSAMVSSESIKGSPATVTFKSGAAAANTSSWAVTPDGAVAADGSQAFTATVTVKDKNNNAVKDATIGFVVPSGLTMVPGTMTTDAGGKMSAKFTATVADDYTLIAQLGAEQIGESAVLSFVAGAASANSSTITATPEFVQANGSHKAVVTVAVFDAKGNAVVDQGDIVAIRSSHGTISAVTQLPNGSYQATVTSTTAGDAEFTFSIDGDDSDETAAATFVATPTSPVVNPTNGLSVSGVTTPGTTVEIRNAANVVIGTTVADTKGHYSITPTVALADNDVITVTSVDEHGFSSAATPVTIDLKAPAKPAVNPSNGKQITGGPIAAGNAVSVVDAGGNPIAGDVTMNEDGTFLFIPSAPFEEGDTVRVFVTSPAGNDSESVDVFIKTTPPTVPTVNPSNGKQITGGPIAETDEVLVLDKDGKPVPGAIEIDENGNFTFVPKTPLTEDDTITVVVKDVAGNTSTPEDVFIKTTAPTVPVVDPSNGQLVTGGPIAENDEVLVLDKDGVQVPGTVEIDSEGNFTFTPDVPFVEGQEITVVVKDVAGNTSTPEDVFIKTTPPTVPSVNPSNGKEITGGPIAENDEVLVLDKDGKPVPGTVQIDKDGNFTFVPETPLTEGQEITVVVKDVAGNTSTPEDVFIKTTPPTVPTVNPSNGKEITGGPIAENDEVLVLDKDGKPVPGAIEIDENGKFTFVPTTPLTEDDTITVVVKDVAGNTSTPEDVFIKTTAPTVPVVDPSNGQFVTGGPIAENDEVLVLDKDGVQVPGTVEIDSEGNFTFTPDVPFVEGQEITVVVKDVAGNTSTPEDVFIKTTPPTVPSVNPSNGKEITGGPIAETDEVLVLDKDGNKVPGTIEVDKDGNFTFVPKTPLTEDDNITVVVKDVAGNTSTPEDVFIKTTPPTVPTVNPSNGKQITGGPIAETDEVLVLDKDGKPVPGTVEIDAEGNFTFVPTTPLTEEDNVTVVVKDVAGNTSTPEDVFIKTTAPTVPVVDPSNGQLVTGGPIAKNDEVLVLDKDGVQVPGTVQIDKDGNFTFVPETPLTEGQEITVVVKDPAGNTSTPEDVFIKTTPPTVPSVNPSNGKEITGGPIAETDEVLVLDKDGVQVPGTIEVDKDGNFTFVPKTPLTEDDIITVVVKDVAGNTSTPEDVFIKTTPPTVPVVDPSNGQLVTGGPIAENDEVLVLDKDGNKVPGTVEIDENGNFTFTPETPLVEGQEITVVVKDPAGNTSTPEDVFIKTTPPTVPSVNPSNGKEITGGPIAKGDEVLVLDKDGVQVPGTVQIDKDGNFTFVPETPLTEGQEITVVVKDPAGNTSEPEGVFVKTTPPMVPSVNPSNGKQITGGPIAETDEVLVLDKDGKPVPGTVEIDAEGNFTFVPKTPLTEDDNVTVVVKDVAGNTSEPKGVFVKTTPPATPVIDPTNGTIVTGGPIAPDTVVTVVDGNGNVIPGVIGVDGQGHFTFTPDVPLTAGTNAKVVVTDEVGNSVEVPIVIDTTKPKPPVIDPTDGTNVTGCAEPGSTVTIRDAHGNIIGTGIAGDDCRFQVELQTELDPNSVITVDVTSPAGNTSDSVTITVGLTSMLLEGGRLAAGETQVARGFGYQPGETVRGELHSEPVDLGTQVANDRGEVVFTFAVPADLELGTHTVTIESNFSGSLSQTFEVYEPEVAVGELMVTGGEALLPLTLGALLVLLGAAALAMTRRRQHSA